MSTNLGTVLVGLGYDLSALEKGAPEAFRLINSQTLGMSAEMKRASREGAESFRLIDEALGVHLSRPLTRILTQEFPAFAKGLQSIMGAGVVGALGVGIFEGIEKGLEKIDQAKKKQEDWAAATTSTQKLMTEGSQHYAESLELVRAKLAAAEGDPGPLHQLEQMRELGKNVEETRKLVDQLGEALAKEGKAAEEAGSLSTRIWSGLGEAPRNLVEGINALDPFGGKGSLLMKMFSQGDQVSQIKAEFSSMKDALDDSLRMDALKGTHNTLQMVTEDLKLANLELTAMEKNGNRAGTELAEQGVRFLTTTKQWIEALDQLNAEQKKLQVAQDAAAAIEKQTSAIKAFYAEIGSAAAKLTPDTDPLHKLEAEIDAARTKAVADFDAMGKAGASALSMDHALAALDQLEKKFASVLAQAKAQADLVKAATELPTKFASAPAPTFGASTGIAPVLGAGGTAAAQFDKFSSDDVAQLKAAAAAYQDLLTPADKFQITQHELNLLLEKGLIDQAAYTAAMQKATEEESKATDQLQKLLEKTDSASAGMQAFFLQLSQGGGKNGGAGSFTFDFLTKSLDGFEDATVKALTGGKAEWNKFFESLDQMALKFALNKTLTSLFKGVAGSGIGKSLGLDKLGLGGGGTAAAAAKQLSAGTIMQSAASTQMAAAQLMAAGGGATPGGPSSFEGFSFSGYNPPGYASGTDSAPGGLSWVGENGPELMNVPAGASITPSSTLRSGHVVNVNIDAKGGEIGVETKIARAIQEAGPRLILQAVTEATEVQRRTPK